MADAASSAVPEAPALGLPPPDETVIGVRIAPAVNLLEAAGAAPGASVLVSLVPPEGRKRAPSDICCVVDVSDSMGLEAMAQDGAGTTVSHGLALLDIVKHALRTIIHTLGDEDRLALVAYANTARTVLELTPMNRQGRALAERRLHALQLDGMTNLWAGLQMGIELLTTARGAGRLQHVLLLTDGVPNINPPRGIVPMLQRLRAKEGGRLPCTVSTFGFGYELDSEMLHELALMGCGSYAFIPDAGFVGTVFVNAVANLLVTMATGVTLALRPLNGASFIAGSTGGFASKRVGETLELDLASLQFGQTKDAVIRMSVPPAAAGSEYLEAEVRYVTRAGGEPLRVTARGKGPFAPDLLQFVHPQLCRTQFVEGAQQVMRMLKLTALDKLNGKGLPLEEAQAHIQVMVGNISSSPAASSDAVAAMLEDLSGQVAEALSREDWYTKWGVHFLPSLLCAHVYQQCNNFKDPGVQHYGGDLFASLRDTADEIFCGLPPPVPSRKAAAPAAAASSAPAAAPWPTPAPAPAPAPVAMQAVSMSAYYDRYAGCIDGSSSVRLADGTERRVEELRKGDMVEAPEGQFAEVVCAVRTLAPAGRFLLVELPGGLRVTPHHPVLVSLREGEEPTWRFPVELAAAEELDCQAVYTFVLRGAPAVVVNGVPCISLGHGIEEGAARHPYLGSARLLEDLARWPGFDAGLVDLAPGSFLRDPSTGLIAGLQMPSGELKQAAARG